MNMPRPITERPERLVQPVLGNTSEDTSRRAHFPSISFRSISRRHSASYDIYPTLYVLNVLWRNLLLMGFKPLPSLAKRTHLLDPGGRSIPHTDSLSRAAADLSTLQDQTAFSRNAGPSQSDIPSGSVAFDSMGAPTVIQPWLSKAFLCSI